ncbi:MAG: TasA family protein [Clostridiales bacterium]|nr:TasA family protein [Clostridiales bacterium]
MKKKILSVCLVAVIAVMAITGASLAYFTDVDTNTNVVTMGDVDIALDEAPVSYDDATYTYTADENADRVKSNTYDNVYPGAVLPKDPTVHNNGTMDAYVRVKITVDFNYLALLQDDDIIFNKGEWDADLRNILNIDTQNWTYAGLEFANDGTQNVNFYYTYNTKLAAGADTTPVFTQVTVPVSFDKELDNAASRTFNIDLEAHAIQVPGFADADAAWTAFDAE